MKPHTVTNTWTALRKGLYLLLALVGMGTLLTACGDDEAEPSFTNKITVNGQQYDPTLVGAPEFSLVEDEGSTYYALYMEFGKDAEGEWRELMIRIPKARNGETIDLTEKIKSPEGLSSEEIRKWQQEAYPRTWNIEFSWGEEVDAWGSNLWEMNDEAFLSGTVRLKCVQEKTREFEVTMKDVRVRGEKKADGKEPIYTIDLSWKGNASVYEGS